MTTGEDRGQARAGDEPQAKATAPAPEFEEVFEEISDLEDESAVSMTEALSDDGLGRELDELADSARALSEDGNIPAEAESVPAAEGAIAAASPPAPQIDLGAMLDGTFETVEEVLGHVQAPSTPSRRAGTPAEVPVDAGADEPATDAHPQEDISVRPAPTESAPKTDINLDDLEVHFDTLEATFEDPFEPIDPDVDEMLDDTEAPEAPDAPSDAVPETPPAADPVVATSPAAPQEAPPQVTPTDQPAAVAASAQESIEAPAEVCDNPADVSFDAHADAPVDGGSEDEAVVAAPDAKDEVPTISTLATCWARAQPACVSLLVTMNYPLRVVPDSLRQIVDWFALTLVFWVPIVWVMALLMKE